MDTSTPEPPAAPNYAQANVSGVAANLATLPAQKQIERAAQLGISTTYSMPILSDTGQLMGYYDPQTADFSGMGDTDLQVAQQKQLLGLAQSATPEILALREQYGVPFVEQQRAEQQASDPEAFALRQQLGQDLQTELGLGSQLSPEQTRLVQQGAREAQTARGNILGVAPAVQETMAQFDVGEALKQRRQSAAQAFVFGQPLASYNVSTAQTGASPFQPLGAGATGTNINPNAGQQGAQFASNIYGTQSQNWATQAQLASQQTNPFMSLGMGVLSTGLGAATGGLSSGIAGAVFPWMR